MNAKMEKLDAILIEELRLYGELARACAEVTEKVRSWDLDGLAAITREQNELIMAVAEVERDRAAALTELLESRDESGQVTEEDDGSVCQRIPEPYASKLADHNESLRTVVDALRVASGHNRSLLNYSSRLIDRAVRFLCGAPESDGTYQRTGSCAGRLRAKRAVLDAQA